MAWPVLPARPQDVTHFFKAHAIDVQRHAPRRPNSCVLLKVGYREFIDPIAHDHIVDPPVRHQARPAKKGPIITAVDQETIFRQRLQRIGVSPETAGTKRRDTRRAVTLQRLPGLAQHFDLTLQGVIAGQIGEPQILGALQGEIKIVRMQMQLHIMSTAQNSLDNLAGFTLAEEIFIEDLDKESDLQPMAIGDIHDQTNAVFPAADTPVNAPFIAYRLEGRIIKRAADAVFGVDGDVYVCFGHGDDPCRGTAGRALVCVKGTRSGATHRVAPTGWSDGYRPIPISSGCRRHIAESRANPVRRG